jgi:hypothetical protein
MSLLVVTTLVAVEVRVLGLGSGAGGGAVGEGRAVRPLVETRLLMLETMDLVALAGQVVTNSVEVTMTVRSLGARLEKSLGLVGQSVTVGAQDVTVTRKGMVTVTRCGAVPLAGNGGTVELSPGAGAPVTRAGLPVSGPVPETVLVIAGTVTLRKGLEVVKASLPLEVRAVARGSVRTNVALTAPLGSETVTLLEVRPVARGSVRVVARGSARVVARGSVRVVARGSVRTNVALTAPLGSGTLRLVVLTVEEEEMVVLELSVLELSKAGSKLSVKVGLPRKAVSLGVVAVTREAVTLGTVSVLAVVVLAARPRRCTWLSEASTGVRAAMSPRTTAEDFMLGCFVVGVLDIR